MLNESVNNLSVTAYLGSAAARAGVFIGDKVTSVNGENVVHASLETARQLIPHSKYHNKYIVIIESFRI